MQLHYHINNLAAYIAVHDVTEPGVETVPPASVIPS